MTLRLHAAVTGGALLMAMSGSGPAFAQRQGGILRMYTPDSPASMSILEEATVFAQGPMMGVFNNLVMFDQQVKQNSLASVATRDIPYFRAPAVILIDHLKEVYIDGVLETIDTTNWLPKVMRKDYTVGLNLAGSGPDPDQNLYLLYGCEGDLNYSGYCSPEVDKLIEQQSIEADEARRKQLIWAIERKLAEDGARPIIFYSRGATCWQPHVKGLTLMVNSIFNGNRREDIWLDK